MTTPHLPDRDEDYGRIADYLLGECSPTDAKEMEADLAVDPQLRNAAELLGLALSATPVTPLLPLDAAWAQLNARIDDAERIPAHPRARRTLRYLNVAFAVAALVGFAWLNYRILSPVVAAHANEHYEAPMELRQLVRLPDGSRATLEPGARLTYRSSFFRRPRALTLEGQARFQARPDAEHPFEVRAGGILAVAVGTVFTVRANPWETAVHVSVEEGVVLTWPDTVRAPSPPHTVNAGQSTDITPLSAQPPSR